MQTICSFSLLESILHESLFTDVISEKGSLSVVSVDAETFLSREFRFGLLVFAVFSST